MPKISKRGSMMPQSPVRKLVPFADKAKKRGTKVLHLNIGQPDIKTPEVAIEAVKNLDLRVLEYSHSAGFESYREGLSAYYKEFDMDVSKDEIIVTTGGSEAVTFALGSIMNDGDEIIIPEPFYANYNGFAAACGSTIVPIESSIETGFALPPISEFEKKITDKTRAIMICNPGNPTGYLYSEEELNQLKEIVIKHDLFIISDEVYREFTYDGETPISILNIEGLEEYAILIDSVSKRYSMCGARIGAIVSKNKDVMATAMKFAQARLSPPTYAQIASEAALKTPKSYFKEVKTEYVKRRNTLVNGLNKIEGVKVPMPKGAFYCVAELPIDDSDKFSQWMLEEFEHNGTSVMLSPATGFYSTPGLGKNQVRLAYVLKEEDLIESVEVLEAALKVYPGRV